MDRGERVAGAGSARGTDWDSVATVAAMAAATGIWFWLKFHAGFSILLWMRGS